jgi:hypothetical protein
MLDMYFSNIEFFFAKKKKSCLHLYYSFYIQNQFIKKNEKIRLFNPLFVV